MGVHWRFRGDTAKRYVIVSKIAFGGVTAHELGHFFGNGHSQVRNNIMSYERDKGARVAFDSRQGERIRAESQVILRDLASGTAPSL
jgi:hypothetical protein